MTSLVSERAITRLYPFAYLSTWASVRLGRSYTLTRDIWGDSVTVDPSVTVKLSGHSLWRTPQRPITLAMIEAGFEAAYRSGR